MKQKCTELKTEIDGLTMIAGDINLALPVMEPSGSRPVRTPQINQT